MKDIISIAVDGPASAGKSTIAREVANRLGITYIDTGAMYRALTHKILENNIDMENEHKIKSILESTKIDFIGGEIHIDDKNVSESIRKNIVSQNVSNLARLEFVRDYMLKVQRSMSYNESLIMDGRDIGTVVLPEADFKFFITASIKERARRRFSELKEKGESNISLSQIEQEIRERDIKDSTRQIAPLKQAEDAILIDNTNLTIEESICKILDIIKSESNVL